MRRENLFDPERGYRGVRFEGIDFFVEHLPWKKLPKEVFEPLGGRDAAKAMRQALLGTATGTGGSSRKRKNSFSKSDPPSSSVVKASAGDSDAVKAEGVAEIVSVKTQQESNSSEQLAVLPEISDVVAINLESKFAASSSSSSSSSTLEGTGLKASEEVTGRSSKRVKKALPRFMGPSPIWRTVNPTYSVPLKVTWELLDNRHV